MMHLKAVILFAVFAAAAAAQETKSITLNPPDTTRGLPFMKTVAVRASATQWSDKEISLQDLSDLLWAANGLNRPEQNKTTAPSAMNAHDVDIYVFMKDGAYLYDYKNHKLDLVVEGDYRSEIVRQRPAAPDAPKPVEPPLQIVLISDADRFPIGTPEVRFEWGALDAGIISQNISLFCASVGLKTRPRAMMNKERIRELLKLKETQHIFLNHPVTWPVETSPVSK